MIYGISTHIVANGPLTGEHLDRIAATGFNTIELFANSHQIRFDNPSVLREISRSVDRNQLYVNSVHAPFYASIEELMKGRFLNIADSDESARCHAVAEISKSFVLASYMEVDYFILHFPGTENRDSLLKSIDELHAITEQIQTKLCFENVPGQNSGVSDIARFIDENQLPFGICFDIGHSHLAGAALKDISESGVYFYTAHIHDNDGIHDLHLPPLEGNIPWSDVMTAFKKVDYKWGFMLEVKRRPEAPIDALLKKLYDSIATLDSFSEESDS